MSREDHVYERQTGVDISSTGTVVGLDGSEGDAQGLSEIAVRLSSGTATTYDLEVSNDASNWWVHKSYSSTSDIDDTQTIPERYVRLKNTGTAADTADAELTASA